jgi:hypothetical protein
MTRVKKRKRQQSCKVAKLIDTIEKAMSTALAIYKAIEPVAKAFLRNGKRTKLLTGGILHDFRVRSCRGSITKLRQRVYR